MLKHSEYPDSYICCLKLIIVLSVLRIVFSIYSSLYSFCFIFNIYTLLVLLHLILLEITTLQRRIKFVFLIVLSHIPHKIKVFFFSFTLNSEVSNMSSPKVIDAIYGQRILKLPRNHLPPQHPWDGAQ